ncbi:MAG: DNA topoisomerase III [Methylocystaceae bacterium]
MKSLVLAEKPSVAKEIARVLGCKSGGKGYLEGPNYVVTWALGHLVTLAEPDDYDPKYKQWRLEDLPMLPDKLKLKTIRQTSHQYQVVKALMKRQDIKDLVIATDAGREGELVARWIMEQANWKKPFSRLWISSQTDEAIREGFRNLKPGYHYDNLYQAAVSRAEADWVIGLNVTRALTCRHNAQLNAGRVQTPTLAMLVKRETEIKNFRPVDFWTLQADFGDYFGDWRDTSGNGRIFDQERAQALAMRVQGKNGIIKEVKTEAKHEAHPLLYDLTELQRDANRRYGFSAQKTLSVLQVLYERHKLVTYPRTDSRYLSADIVPTLEGRLKSINTGPYADLIKPLLGRPLPTSKRLVDNSKVSDHHALIPTGQTLHLDTLDGDEKKLYDLVVRRFIAVFYSPFRYDLTTMVTVVDGETFFSRGRVIKEHGWKVVNTKSIESEAVEGSDEEKLPEQTLRQQKQGSAVLAKSCKVNRGKTRPPARYTEATLLTAMEHPGKYIEDEDLRESMKQAGLGTPATRAEIIEKLVKTFYVERNGKELVPTDKGSQLIAMVPSSLRTPDLTAQWEQELADIAQGKAKRDKFIQDIRKNARELVQMVIEDETKFKHTNVTREKCPLCGQYLLAVKAKKGRMLVCPDPQCGHRQAENQRDDMFSNSKQGRIANQKMIARYSDKEDVGTNLGELLKKRLEEQNKGK